MYDLRENYAEKEYLSIHNKFYEELEEKLKVKFDFSEIKKTNYSFEDLIETFAEILLFCDTILYSYFIQKKVIKIH
jgi:hypothetical protein